MKLKGNVGLEAKKGQAWFRKTRCGGRQARAAEGQEAGGEPVGPYLGLQGPETARFEQARRD